MTSEIDDALFDFLLALRLELAGLPDEAEADPLAALDRLPVNAGLPLNQVAGWPKAAQAGLRQLLEVWRHVDAIARERGMALGYPEGMTERTRPTKLGAAMVAWLRRAGPSLAPMTGDLGLMREGHGRLVTDASGEAEAIRRPRLRQVR